MPGDDFDLGDYFASPAPLTLERLLVVDYLFARGLLPRDLYDLPQEQAAVLFAKARSFAIWSLRRVKPTVALSSYLPVGFSHN